MPEAGRFFVGVFFFFATTLFTADATRFLMPLEVDDLPTEDLVRERVPIFTFTTQNKAKGEGVKFELEGFPPP